MLPRWSEPERLLLSEQNLVLHRRGKSYAVELPLERPGHIEFDSLLATLPPAMTKLSGHRLNLVVANSWVRYLILPWQEHVYAHKDWLALATNRMRERYGAKAADWDVKVSMQGYRQPVVAAAIDRPLAEGLDRLADIRHWHLQLIQPAFVALVNRYPRHWRGDSWLMMADKDRVLLAESQAGVWQRINYLVTSPEMLTQHALMLIQQARQFNPDSRKRRLYLYSGATSLKQDFVDDMEIRPLSADWLKGGQQ